MVIYYTVFSVPFSSCFKNSFYCWLDPSFAFLSTQADSLSLGFFWSHKGLATPSFRSQVFPWVLLCLFSCSLIKFLIPSLWDGGRMISLEIVTSQHFIEGYHIWCTLAFWHKGLVNVFGVLFYVIIFLITSYFHFEKWLEKLCMIAVANLYSKIIIFT